MNYLNLKSWSIKLKHFTLSKLLPITMCISNSGLITKTRDKHKTKVRTKLKN